MIDVKFAKVCSTVWLDLFSHFDSALWALGSLVWSTETVMVRIKLSPFPEQLTTVIALNRILLYLEHFAILTLSISWTTDRL